MSYMEDIIQFVPLCKFNSIHMQRDQVCGGCDVRSYNYERDGEDGCDCMNEFYITGKCKRYPDICVGCDER